MHRSPPSSSDRHRTPQEARRLAGAISLRTHGAKDSEHLTQLERFCAPLRMSLNCIRREHERIEIDVSAQALPGMLAMTGKLHGAQFRRLVDTDVDEVGLLVNFGGKQFIAQRGREIVLDDGEATLVSSVEPMDWAHRVPGTAMALRLPQRQLAALVPGLDDLHYKRIPRNAEALQFLTGYVALVRRQQFLADSAVKHATATHLYDLMALTVGAARDVEYVARSRGLRAARLAQLKADIAQRLHQGDLAVAELAARHRCTPRFLQRLFEADGTTFTEYVLRQRLARAYRLLSDPNRVHEKIATLAFDCGFNDVSYFNRAFRRAYGAAPSDVRAEAVRVPLGGNWHDSDA